MSVSSNILTEKFRNLLLEEEPCYDELQSLMDDNVDEDFPTTSITRVLLVEEDPNSLLLMKSVMTKFPYQVTYYENGEDAMAFLKKKRHEIDLVLWDYHMSKINGLEALKTIDKEMDLPVVTCDHKDTVKKLSTLYSPCDFLVKPVSKEVTSVLWQYVFHKRMPKSILGQSVGSDLGGLIGQHNDDLCQSNKEGSKNVEESVKQSTTDQIGVKSSSKKRRMSWTPELHHKFEVAVEKLSTVDKVYPKHILKYIYARRDECGRAHEEQCSHSSSEVPSRRREKRPTFLKIKKILAGVKRAKGSSRGFKPLLT